MSSKKQKQREQRSHKKITPAELDFEMNTGDNPKRKFRLSPAAVTAAIIYEMRNGRINPAVDDLQEESEVVTTHSTEVNGQPTRGLPPAWILAQEIHIASLPKDMREAERSRLQTEPLHPDLVLPDELKADQSNGYHVANLG